MSSWARASLAFTVSSASQSLRPVADGSDTEQFGGRRVAAYVGEQGGVVSERVGDEGGGPLRGGLRG